MAELLKYGSVQIDNYRRWQNFAVKPKKINLIKMELQFVEQLVFFIIHMYMIWEISY